MATPSPTPLTDELETFSEITFIPSDEALGVVSAYDQAVADEKWLRTLDDIDAWASIGAKSSKVKRLGNIEFFEQKAEEARLAFRNKVRRRYGYAPIDSELEAETDDLTVASLEYF